MLSTFLALFSIDKECVLALPCTLLNHTLSYKWMQKCTLCSIGLAETFFVMGFGIAGWSRFWFTIFSSSGSQTHLLYWFTLKQGEGQAVGSDPKNVIWSCRRFTISLWRFIMGVSRFDPWCGFSMFCEKCLLSVLQFCFQLLVMGEQTLSLRGASSAAVWFWSRLCPLFFWMWIWVRSWMYGVLPVLTA